MTYRILDLCCGEGGAGWGYHLAGFEVWGIDHEPQPRYPFHFIQADVFVALSEMMQFPELMRAHYDAIHAAPPCQRYSVATPARLKESMPDLVPPMREFLNSTGLPWVIENVPGAPLEHEVTLCGSSFHLQADDTDGERLWLKRHRRFETGGGFWVPGTACNHPEGMQVAGSYNAGSTRKGMYDSRGKKRGYVPPAAVQRVLFGMPWATADGIYQATPPAYTEYIGIHLKYYLDSTSNRDERSPSLAEEAA